MWTTFAIVTAAVVFYYRESFSIEAISVGVIAVLLTFFAVFPITDPMPLDSAALLSGFAAPALIAIMALLVVGQGLYHTGALEAPIIALSGALENAPRKTLAIVFGMAFLISMFMNNTPVVVMFIPILSSLAARMRGSASRYMMPLSFLCILAGMTTLIGSSTNLLVNDVLRRTTGEELGFFTQFGPGMFLALVGTIYIIVFAPILLPNRADLKSEVSESGKQYIAQIRVTERHPLNKAKPVAGLFSELKNVTVRMVQRGDTMLLPPFEHTLIPGDVLIIAASRKELQKLLASDKQYLKGMLDIAGFENTDRQTEVTDAIVMSEAVVAPASRFIGRSVEQIGFRRATGTLVLGIQRRSSMIRKRMLDIRLEAGDTLLLFGYEADMRALRTNRDMLLLEWSQKEVQDIRKARAAQAIFLGVMIIAALGLLPIEVAALGGAVGMIALGCLNIRQAVRALDMRIFLLIAAAFAMGLAIERTGGAAFIGMSTVALFEGFGDVVLLSAIFAIVAILTNLISNSATALLFAPIGLAISQQTGIPPMMMVLTVIFAANCSFATPIAYQTNLLVMGPGHYNFRDFTKFGIPLIIVIWLAFTAMVPFLI
jgi:di/tricarboxylate transporter